MSGRRTISFFCLVVFLPSLLAGQESHFPAQPAPVTPAPRGSAPSGADYGQEPFVIEKFYTSARFENDGTSERDLSVRIRVQSDAGVQQLGELTFGYNSANEQLDVRSVRVRKPDGTVISAGAEAVKEMTASVERDAPVYTDYKEKHVTVPSLHSGDLLEYELATRLVTPLAPGQFWYAQSFLKSAIVLDERLDVTVPRGRKLTIKSAEYSRNAETKSPEAGYPGSKTQVSSQAIAEFTSETAGDREILHWKHRQLAHPSDDEDDPEKKKPSKPKDAGPDVQLTTFQNWNEIGQWYATLERGRTDPTPEIRAKTQALLEGRSSELEKIRALYDYVSQNIRYVSLSFGLGRYQPHSAGEVFSNQYGDCKDKVTLLAAMLRAANIPSDAALIPFSRELDASVPSPSQFDHVITAVPVKNELVWMDTTAEVAPFRLLAAPLRKKSALLVPATGEAKITETPADPPFPSTQNVEIEGQVSDLGKLTAKLRYAMRGDNELALRLAFRRTPQKQWKQLGQTLATLDGLQGEVSSVKPSDPADTSKPFVVELEFSQANFLDWSSKKGKTTLPFLGIGIPQVPDDNADPIQIGSPLDVTMKLTLTLPPGIRAQAPVAMAVARDYAEYKSTYQVLNHTLTAERSLQFKMRELPASRTSDYLAFSRAVQADSSQMLSVENSAVGTPSIPASAKAEELLEAGLAALNSGNPRAAVPLFQRAVELEPKHKQAWNDLGLARLRLGQFDDAAAAFRKQADVNPYDEHAYDYLGVALQQQTKYTEAAEAYRKQLAINPLDPFAHAALGGLFLEQHRYSEAVPELDKATVLMPENAGIQVNLGQAYLNTGEREKALAAFEKGAELSQTPTVWNNVAYSLADHRMELARAQQYAESAVAATAANLRNVEFAHLAIEDLNQVQSIGSYWDTLGWVYFQKGELAQAEKFIRASWLLNQHGEVGDHLAQIFEKRGQKDQAAELYAMAIAATHGVPETRGRLAALLGIEESDPKIEGLVKAARPKLAALRTFSAGRLLSEKAEAEFFVELAPGVAGAKASAVQFISGSEELRPLAARLQAIDFGPMFPDASPVQLIRRGTLSCSAAGECNFALVLPEDVRTVN